MLHPCGNLTTDPLGMVYSAFVHINKSYIVPNISHNNDIECHFSLGLSHLWGTVVSSQLLVSSQLVDTNREFWSLEEMAYGGNRIKPPDPFGDHLYNHVQPIKMRILGGYLMKLGLYTTFIHSYPYISTVQSPDVFPWVCSQANVQRSTDVATERRLVFAQEFRSRGPGLRKS